MKKMRTWSTYTLGIGFILPLLVFLGFLYRESSRPDPLQGLATTLADSLRGNEDDGEGNMVDPDAPAWREFFPKTVPMKIGGVSLEASVASSWPDRIKGLSLTPYLPPEVAKFFVFESAGFHSIWMKDMNYAIDIIWVDGDGVVVDFVEAASPDSYPESFTPDQPAYYVIEVVSGFVAEHGINIGTKVDLPEY